MKTPEEIAQWVIDNRYPKNEKDKVSDFEMYLTLIEYMDGLSPKKTNQCVIHSPTDSGYCIVCKQQVFLKP